MTQYRVYDTLDPEDSGAACTRRQALTALRSINQLGDALGLDPDIFTLQRRNEDGAWVEVDE